MQHKPVQHALQAHFPLDPRRLDFIARFVVALLKVRTVNLAQVATALGGHALLESNAKRARRFLDFDLAQEAVARFVLSFIHEDKLILCMDRTNWKLGSVSINFLVVAVAYRGIALPIAWVNLDKEGNSSQAERKALFARVLKLVPATRILGFTADREFIGETWFKALLEHGVNPVIRIRKDTTISHRQKTAPAWAWFHTLKPGDVLELSKARVMGIRVFVIGTLTPKGEFLLVVTTRRPSRALSIYARRWDIETLFGAFKSRGFNLEATKVTDPVRSERLFALLVVALIWAVRVGEVVSSLKPTPIRGHGRPVRSLFRVGLDCLRHILLSGRSDGLVLDDVVPLLSGS